MPFLASALGSALAGTALGGALTWLGGSTILAGVARFGLGIAAQYALGAILGNQTQAQAVKLEVTFGEAQPREIILGRCGTAGSRVYRNAHGDGNRHVGDVFRISDFRVTGIDAVRFEGEWHGLGSIDPTPDLGRPILDTEAVVYVKLYTGEMDQTANGHLIGSSNPPGRWTTNHRGAGISYVYVPQVLDREHLQRPWEPFFSVYGAPLYDWRKDDTAGGDGDHRWDDQDTWEFSENPVLMMYALCRGFHNGTERIIGKGTPASRLPLAKWTIAANICDEIVDGGTRYSAGIIAAAGDGITHDQNMKPLLEACAATWVEDASGEYPIVGAVQTPLATFTDDDIMPNEPYRFSRYRPRSELVNTVTGTYRDVSKFYESVPFEPRIDTAAVTEDRERLAASIPFSAVNRPEVADRLADIAIRASRYQANAEVCIHPKYLDRTDPGRWVVWDSEENGTRTFQIVEKRLGPIGEAGTRNIYLTLQEVADGVFDPTEYVTVPTVPLPPGTPVYAEEADNFLAAGVGVEAENEEIIPGFRFTWSAFTDVTVVGIDIEYRPLGETDSVIKNVRWSPDDPQLVLVTVEGVLSDTEYEYRHKIVTLPVRTTFWTDWGDVQSPTASLPPVSVGLAQIQADVRQLWQQANENFDDIMVRIETLATAMAEGSGVMTTENYVAKVFRDATAVAYSALSASIEETEEGLEAAAEAITALEATVGDSGAGALWRMTVVAGSGTVVAMVVLQVRATVGGTWVDAGTIWEAGIDGGTPYSRIVMKADQFVVTDGTDEGLPFVIEGGEVKLQVAKIGTAIIEEFQSANGKIKINGSGTDSDISIYV